METKLFKSCPFNPSHNVKVQRFVKHIEKCAKQYPHIKYLQCRFNRQHIIRPGEELAHVQECPDFANIVLGQTEENPSYHEEGGTFEEKVVKWLNGLQDGVSATSNPSNDLHGIGQMDRNTFPDEIHPEDSVSNIGSQVTFHSKRY